MDIAEMLGIDQNDPVDMLAERHRNDDIDMFRHLRRLRESRGLTQRQVAERMEVDQSTVARIESGLRDVHLSTLRLYALALHARIDRTVVDVHDEATGLPRLEGGSTERPTVPQLESVEVGVPGGWNGALGFVWDVRRPQQWVESTTFSVERAGR
ncbi:helix-turn-helix domain-containing protein [Janibacter melonis]|uniref:helix-turn-helix domain-containing protein n=1 Tax=Janibacter melonis TaxID=262209 RepID=UPI0020442C49|nr:helix-turn-helix transcriptional regulator [Janibacter melonis]MCM3555684.1 helix-turn-helix domain-containing protein [Janibacter melonis]